MKKLIFILFLSIISCNKSKNAQNIPVNMQPEWQNIESNKMPLKFGQIIEIENIEIKSIVLDYNEDESGVWIGLCPINENKLFGRQIPQNLINSTCLDLLDFVYIQIKDLKNYKKIELLDIDINKVGIGNIYPISNEYELKDFFNSGIEERKKEQTPCNEGLTGLNPVRECYFDLSKIEIK
ncbi:hypothetical protein [Aureivirga marina]|uniref:hypothetical protein n=1 Tax=Aureivirga marina TaxID=1182451 RepID=UPI0018C9F461|nr:hypothetical protein [Aureivirga marina]